MGSRIAILGSRFSDATTREYWTAKEFFVTNFQIAAFSSLPNEISMKPEAFDVAEMLGKQ